MNAVEIEAALSELALKSFDGEEFPYAFLAAFGNKETTIKRLRRGDSNATDVPGAVLQRNHIHILVTASGEVGAGLTALRESPRTAQAKVKFLLATDGVTVEAEQVASGETLACEYPRLPDYFGFFLPLAGISTIKEIEENPIDVRATGRLSKLYVELLRENPEWAAPDRRGDMNHFMARLIFCLFAEDTDIFNGDARFTRTVDQMSERDGANTHEVLATLFRAMSLTGDARTEAELPRWAAAFPEVNGGLFSGAVATPRFTRTARSYLFQAGQLDWKAINPDIFGSMIQAVADDEERGALGLHYTSVPNILKVLNPLFLDDLRAQLEAAGDSKQKLLNLRKRMARIRVFDPACGSGNFLVIAYKEMRAIEAVINAHRGEDGRKSDIPLTNFRGIEIRDFPAEIARLALIIAEFQCDVLYRGQLEALKDVLPLNSQNWIVCGNALQLDWTTICPPTGTTVKLTSDDLFGTPLDQSEIDFENEGGETYVCGNPPYRGSKWQTPEQKAELARAWREHPKLAKTTDYVTGWIARFLDYADAVPNVVGAFVATNSICQGQQATDVWPVVFERGCEIRFAHASFKWANLAARNAGVSVVVVGIGQHSSTPKLLFDGDLVRSCAVIGPYLVPNSAVYVGKASAPLSGQAGMLFGNMPRDGGHLLLDHHQARELVRSGDIGRQFVKRYMGADELISGKLRFCLWIEDSEAEAAVRSPVVAARLAMVAEERRKSKAPSTRQFASQPHRFVQRAGRGAQHTIVVASVSSENREYLPVDLVTGETVVSNTGFAMFDAPAWNLAFLASRMHWVWIGVVCVRLEMRVRYSNTIGWNPFPIPTLTEQNKRDLTRSAEEILLAREAHFPASIADLYNPESMPEDLRRAHERNDEALERIYIGRRFKNDTERLEKLFELYTRMIADQKKAPKGAGRT